MPDRLDDVEDPGDDGKHANHDRQGDCGGDRGEQGDQAENDRKNAADYGKNPDSLCEAGKLAAVFDDRLADMKKIPSPLAESMRDTLQLIRGSPSVTRQESHGQVRSRCRSSD